MDFPCLTIHSGTPISGKLNVKTTKMKDNPTVVGLQPVAWSHFAYGLGEGANA